MKNKLGFTLIEMLVVVLIIGILAGVALPQYQKSVMKAKLTQLDILVNAAKKNVQLYIEANGWPEDIVYFTGSESVADIEMPGDIEDSWVINNGIYMDSSCSSSFCSIFFNNDNFALEFLLDRYIGNFWFASHHCNFENDYQKVFCQYLKERNYKAEENIVEMCEEVNITLESVD